MKYTCDFCGYQSDKKEEFRWEDINVTRATDTTPKIMKFRKCIDKCKKQNIPKKENKVNKL